MRRWTLIMVNLIAVLLLMPMRSEAGSGTASTTPGLAAPAFQSTWNRGGAGKRQKAPLQILAGVNFFNDTDMPPNHLPVPGLHGWNIEVQYLKNPKDCSEIHVYAAAAQRQGLLNLIRFEWIPATGGEGGSGNTLPQLKGTSKPEQLRYIGELASWAALFRRCAIKHQAVAYAFIVGNEPNLPSEGAIGPKAYASAFNMVRDVVRKSLPNARLLFVGPAAYSPAGQSAGGETWSSGLDWFEQALANVKDVDGFAIHTYGGFGRKEGSCPEHPSAPCIPKTGEGDFGFRQYRDLLDRIVKKRPRFAKKPVYITEFNTASTQSEGVPIDTYLSGWIGKAFEEVRNFNACHQNDRPQILGLAWFVDRMQPEPWWQFALSNIGSQKLASARQDLQQEFKNPVISAQECNRDLDEGRVPGGGGGDGDPGGCNNDTCGSGSTTGDPHLVTLDGLAYDFQAVGEFVLAQAVAGEPLVVQVRQQPWPGSRRVAMNTAVAARLGPDRVAIYAGRDIPVWVNGTPASVTDVLTLPGGGKVYSRAGEYVLAWGGDERLHVRPAGHHLELRLRLPQSRRNQVRGLLGNFNGMTDDDLTVRTGVTLPLPPAFAQLYGEYGASWRISAAESLFDYLPGEDTGTFTDLTFPDSAVYLGGLDASVRQAAEQSCAQAGVTSPILLQNCVIDLAMTNDLGFASSAKFSEAPTAGSQAFYFADLEGAPGPEWSNRTTGTTPRGGRRFLGEFGNETVSLNLSSLPVHTEVVVSFDLFILKSWDGNDGGYGPDIWSVSRDNGQSLLRTTFSNTGALQAYPQASPEGSNPGYTGAAEVNTLGYTHYGDSVYRLRLRFPHTDAALSLRFTGEGLQSIGDESWGLDNVEVQVVNEL